jgi:hypothetical protein
MYSKVKPYLRPKDIQYTIQATWNTVHRLPTYLLEPKYLQIFEMSPEQFPSAKQVRAKALEVREKASQLICEKPVNKYFLEPKNFENIRQAVRVTMKQLRLLGEHFAVSSIKEAASELPTDTSSGHPDYVSKKGENLDHAVMQAVDCLNLQNTDWVKYICTMAWRTQTRLSGIKYRIIWVTPHISQIFEMCFFSAFRKHFETNKNTPYCFGNVFVDLVPRIKKLRTARKIVVLDYTSFDQTIPPELIDLFFTAIKKCLRIRNKSWDIQFEAVRSYNLFSTVFNLLHGEPTLISKIGSINSGSVFTNFMGSWINLFLTNLFLLEKGFDPENDYIPNVMGDDCAHGFFCDFDHIEYSVWLKQNFGMVVETEKCQILPPDFYLIEFLGADVNESGRFINLELAKRQLVTSHIFIGETVMTEADRLISKAASICFKFTDGWRFFDYICEQLLPLLNLDDIPEYYTELFYSSAGPFSSTIRRRIADYKYNGWLVQ